MKRYALILSIILLLAVFAEYVAPYDPLTTDATKTYLQPSSQHWFGTDQLGRDVLSRVLHGGKNTLFMAVASTIVTIIPGLLIGILAGISRLWDRVTRLLINTLLSFPVLILALVILAILGRGIPQIILAVGIAQIPYYARISRIAILSILHLNFIEAAIAMGASRRHIYYRHVLPAAFPTLLTYAVITLSYAVLNGAALSFLGLINDPALPDWGIMLATGRTVIRTAPWVVLAPGIALTLTLMTMNRLVDHLNAGK